MAHDNNNGNTYKAVSAISKNLSKKGKIKGKNKKETKYLQRACVHHYYNRKGKLKPAFINAPNGDCVCELCHRSFPSRIESKESVKNMIEPILGLLNQSAAAAVAGKLGNKAVDEIVAIKVGIEKFPKTYTRITKAVSKADNIKKKKHKNENGGGSSQYGGWSRK